MADVERVPLDQVRDLIVLGEPLPLPVFDALGRLLLNQSQVVTSERQFDALMERGAWVERPRAEEVRRQRAGKAPSAPVAAQRQLTLFDRAAQFTADLDAQNRQLARGAGRVEGLRPLVQRLLEGLDRDADVALYLCMRQDGKKAPPYPTTHPVHCAVVSALTARALGWTPERVSSLVGAALTMNASFFDLQGQLAAQRDPPTRKQLEQIRAHPHASAQLLRQAGVIDAEWIEAVQDHHEQLDGKGYPRGATELADAAVLLRLVDVYTAKVSPRALRPALVPQLAAQQLFQQHGKSPRESPIAAAMIRTLGIHPPGTLVQLKSGEVAVVARRPKTGTAPLVATLSNRKGEPVVGTQLRDSADGDAAIASPLADTSRFQRILPERVYGMLLA